jgi:hypothetical protein
MEDLTLRFDPDTFATIVWPADNHSYLVLFHDGTKAKTITLTLDQFDQLVSLRNFLGEKPETSSVPVTEVYAGGLKPKGSVPWKKPEPKPIGLEDLWAAMDVLAHFKTHDISVSKETWLKIKAFEMRTGTDEEHLANAQPFIRNGVTIRLAKHKAANKSLDHDPDMMCLDQLWAVMRILKEYEIDELPVSRKTWLDIMVMDMQSGTDEQLLARLPCTRNGVTIRLAEEKPKPTDEYGLSTRSATAVLNALRTLKDHGVDTLTVSREVGDNLYDIVLPGAHSHDWSISRGLGGVEIRVTEESPTDSPFMGTKFTYEGQEIFFNQRQLEESSRNVENFLKRFSSYMNSIFFDPAGGPLRRPSGWTSVEDRLPEPGAVVIASDGFDVFAADYIDQGKWLPSPDYNDPTHWMPLPDPPGS